LIWLEKKFPKILKNVDLHIAFIERKLRYQMNFFRNIAWKYSSTPYILILDIDFIPSSNLVDELIKFSQHPFMELIKEKKGVLALPTFHWNCKCNVLHCKSEEFHDSCSRGLPMLHDHVAQEATNITRWYNSTTPYEVQYSIMYEPYIFGSRNMTQFDEMFDYGNDKVQHMYELAAQKYKIFVLPNAFVGHLDHVEGVHKSPHEHNGVQDAWRVFDLFNRRIRHEYNYNFFCENVNLAIHIIPTCMCQKPYCMDL
jgi:hypothetical protein